MRTLHNQKGFTLVELAIVMIIFGLFASVLLYGLNVYYRHNEITKTKEALEYSQAALHEFRSVKKRFPCPADPTLGPTDVNYGRENCDPTTSGVDDVIGRDADNIDGDNDPNTGGDVVLIGAIPFATMLDPDGDPTTEDGIIYTPYTEMRTIDGWNRKLTYAVTQNLTDKTTYGDALGAIDIVDEYGNTVLGREGTAQIALVSHGENGKGAYTRLGESVELCAAIPLPPGAPPPPVPNSELDNCDDDANFLSGLRNENDFAYNDDYTQYMMTQFSTFWVYTGIDPVTGIPLITNTNAGRIGIGTNEPEQRLHVDGNVKATEAQAIMFCDGDGNNCMMASAIAGDLDQMKCSTFNQAVTGVEVNSVNCERVFPENPASLGDCPPGQAVTGIGSNPPRVICATLP